MIKLSKRTVTLDFSAVNNIKFKCISNCAKCCFYQAPVLSSAAINRIRNALKTKTKEEYDQFIFDWLSFTNRLDTINDELYEDCEKSIKLFWTPFQLEELNEVFVVRNYTIYSMPSTGRCKLLNPIDFKCFVYNDRPSTCRSYPFIHEISDSDVFHVKTGMSKCPGIGSGSSIDKMEYQKMTENDIEEITRDIELLNNFVKKSGYKEITRKTRNKKISSEEFKKAHLEFENEWRNSHFFGKKKSKDSIFSKNKKIIEPLAELGVIPSQLLIKMFNEQIEERGFKNGV